MIDLAPYLCPKCGHWHVDRPKARRRCHHNRHPSISYATEQDCLGAIASEREGHAKHAELQRLKAVRRGHTKTEGPANRGKRVIRDPRGLS